VELLGIDIGGSGIKGAPVDVDRGILVTERHRIATPQPAVPAAMVKVVAEIARHFSWSGPIGCTLPGVVKDGVAYSAANIDRSWIGTDGERLLRAATGCPVLLLNDADAAGIAEMRFGAGRGHVGLVVVITIGTGIGSAVFYRGELIPNTEFGHLEIRGKDAEDRASDRVRDAKQLSWERWSRRVTEYLGHLERLLSPDLIILGGGVSQKHEKFLPLLRTTVQVVPAQLRNDAGIVGAALAAQHLAERSDPVAQPSTDPNEPD
jgi:polyphosphate glucokinase